MSGWICLEDNKRGTCHFRSSELHLTKWTFSVLQNKNKRHSSISFLPRSMITHTVWSKFHRCWKRSKRITQITTSSRLPEKSSPKLWFFYLSAKFRSVTPAKSLRHHRAVLKYSTAISLTDCCPMSWDWRVCWQETWSMLFKDGSTKRNPNTLVLNLSYQSFRLLRLNKATNSIWLRLRLMTSRRKVLRLWKQHL
jgi:hypothetical protein